MKKVKCIDGFYETLYTAQTASKIKELYKKYYQRLLCLICKQEPVDIKMGISDTYNPTFVITRKQYCIKCWLNIINS